MTTKAKRRALGIGGVVAALALVACSSGGAGHEQRAAGDKPNIVFVLTDDLAWNLVPYMPHVAAMRKAGVTFSRYFVTDSLCCPSRASLLSGRFPHSTHVFTNGGLDNDGGFQVFHSRGEENDTVATDLHAAGYRTALMGKYLNGYSANGTAGQAPFIPPGWDEWDVAGDAAGQFNAYSEFNYDLNENGHVVHYGSNPEDYLTDVVSGKALSFVDESVAAKSPFFLELATFAPHQPYTPAPRHAGLFPNLQAPRTPAFNRPATTGEPPWLASVPPLTRQEIAAIDTHFRMRAQSVQAVDEMMGKLETKLRETGQLANTYIVFNSDNGFHMGDHRLTEGKLTAFDTDIKVPLVITGPGVPANTSADEIAENIDIRPTFDELAGVTPSQAIEGHSLVPLLRGQNPTDWRTTALVEHHGGSTDSGDPDLQAGHSGNPPSYAALRTTSATYIEYVTGEREYYDVSTDPYEVANQSAQLPDSQVRTLHDALVRLQACVDGPTCWAAGHISP